MAGTGVSRAVKARRSAFAFLVCCQSSLKADADTSGLVETTAKMLSAGERLQLACQRELLIADLREARRRHSPTSSISAELNRITRRLLAK